MRRASNAVAPTAAVTAHAAVIARWWVGGGRYPTSAINPNAVSVPTVHSGGRSSPTAAASSGTVADAAVARPNAVRAVAGRPRLYAPRAYSQHRYDTMPTVGQELAGRSGRRITSKTGSRGTPSKHSKRNPDSAAARASAYGAALRAPAASPGTTSSPARRRKPPRTR